MTNDNFFFIMFFSFYIHLRGFETVYTVSFKIVLLLWPPTVAAAAPQAMRVAARLTPLT